jgi:hypothetical protein
MLTAIRRPRAQASSISSQMLWFFGNTHEFIEF